MEKLSFFKYDIQKLLNSDLTYNIFIFGDSHSKCFYRNEFLNVDNINIYNHYKSSVSMKGLSNLNSRLKYHEFIFDKLTEVQPIENTKNICLLKFGQVDIEYNYFYKVYNNKENLIIEEFYKSLVQNYILYIENLKSSFPHIEFVINGVNMPNMYDIQKYIKDNICFITEEISYESQFRNHLMFNKILSSECVDKNILYFDLTNETTNKNKLKPEFIGRDNHFSGAEFTQIYNNNTYETFIRKLLSIIG